MSFTSPNIQLQILQHQLQILQRKQQPSHKLWELLIVPDITISIIIGTITIVSIVTIRKQIWTMIQNIPPLLNEQQNQQHDRMEQTIKTWYNMQYSMYAKWFHGTVSTTTTAHGSENNIFNDDGNHHPVTRVGDTSMSNSIRTLDDAVPTQQEQQLKHLTTSSIAVSNIPDTFEVPTKVNTTMNSKEMHDLTSISTPLTAAAVASSSSDGTKRPQTCYKYLEILVHNVSHTDLVLGLDLPNIPLGDKKESNDNDTEPQHSSSAQHLSDMTKGIDQSMDGSNNSGIPPDDDSFSSPYMKNYIRPRFSSFDSYCRLVLDHVNNPQNPSISSNDGGMNSAETKTKTTTIIHFPRYHRSMIDPRYAIQQVQDQLTMKKKYVPPKMAPTGIELSVPVPLPVAATQPSLQEYALEDTIRIRGCDVTTILSALKQDSNSYVKSENEASISVDNAVSIKYVFFPLLATLLPVWYRQIKEKEYQEPVKRVLILVTGVGTPRNYTHSIHGNSTEACADLMKVFVSNIDPTLSVVKVFSDSTNIFRTDENILFCERELIPLINAYRNAHVMGTAYPDDDDYVPIVDETSVYFDDDTEADWRTRLHVTLSFADGSPARTQAIQSSLRSYKPTYFHFWQLKTFWHESKIVDDDIEVHSFATMESIPAIDTSQIRDPYIQAIVSEMRSFYDEMVTALHNKDNDIDRFWLRKSHKPVLAVLLVQSSSSSPTSDSNDGTNKPNFRLYRGTNMEVSMPTGSLCAERNAIGSALAMNPNLKRHDLKMIAVLAVPPFEPNPSSISSDHIQGNQMDNVPRIMTGKSMNQGEKNAKISDNIRRITSYSSILEESIDPNDDDNEEDENVDLDMSTDERVNEYYIRKSSIGSDYEPTTTITTTATTNSAVMNGESIAQISDTINSSQYCLPIGTTNDIADVLLQAKATTISSTRRIPTEPIRRIPLFPKAPSTTITTTESLSKNKIPTTSNVDITSNQGSNSNNTSRMQQRTKRTVVVQSHKDMNPLLPCGACQEWIKKIAQCNPYFKIITFTDANCNGMYISPCSD